MQRPQHFTSHIRFPWISAGHSPVKPKCKNTGRLGTQEAKYLIQSWGEGKMGQKRGHHGLRAANKATFRQEQKDRALQKRGPKKNNKGNNKKPSQREEQMNYLMCMEINVSRHLKICRSFWEKKDGCIETKASNGKMVIIFR